MKVPFIRQKPLVLIVFLVMIFGCSPGPERKLQQADKLFTQARLFIGQQNYLEGLRTIRQAIDLNNELKRDSVLGESYFLLANVQRSLGQYDSALAGFKIALEYFRLTGDKKSERNGRITLAEFYYSANEYEYAATLADDAVASAKFFDDRPNIYSALLIAAKTNHKLGRYEREGQILDEFVQIDSLYNGAHDQTDIFNFKLQAYAAAGKYNLTRNIFAQWTDAAISIGDTMALARAYYAMGRIYQSMNHPDSAVRSFSHSLDFLNQKTNRPLEEDVLVSLGNIAYRSRHIDQAKRYYHDALMIARQMNNIVIEQLLNLILVACDWKTSNAASKGITDEFVQRFSSIKGVCQQEGFSAGQAFADVLLGRVAEQSNDLGSALKSYEEAQQLIEQHVRTSFNEIPVFELINVFMEGESTGWYDAVLQLNCSLENISDAFVVLERKNLSDLIQFFSRLTFKTSDINLTQQLADIRWKRNVLGMLDEDILLELSAGKQRNPDRLHVLQELYPHRAEELAGLADEIGAVNSNYRWLTYPKSLTLKEVQTALPANSALVEYAPLANALYCIVVTRDSAYIRKANVSRETVISMVQEYNNLISDSRLNTGGALFNDWAVLSRMSELSPALYNIFLAPIMSILNTATTLYIVPPAELGWLPFHTLRANGAEKSASIFEKFNVSYLPSAAALFFNQVKEKPVETVVGFGHQGRTTWDVEYELKDIRSFYDKARMVFDTSATLDHLMRVKCDILHIGGEFVLNTNVPDNSVMVLSDGVTPDGLHEVSLGELFGMTAPPTIAFSNISTVAGGLSRYAAMGLLANGSPAVIATMWQGDRKAKKYFGEVFYTGLMTGMTSTQAYRQAMIALPKREEFSPLHRWGLFYLYGK